MPIAWDPKRWWNFCMKEDEVTEIEPIFTEKCFQCASVIYNLEVLKYFATKT